MQLTEEQRAAIDSAGKVIVSASAGSGKTFVMIKKLVAAIESGVDLDGVLAVTFTKKAAAQMKEKLRAALIERMAHTDTVTRARLKIQLSKIPTSNISTIHAFCARLLRTYFYCVGIDGTFDIIAADDAQAKEFKRRALDSLFEKYYAEGNRDFIRLLQCFRKKRSDNALRGFILEGYEKLRITANYTKILKGVESLYTEEGFARVCKEYSAQCGEKFTRLKGAVEEFAQSFKTPSKAAYDKIFAEMISALTEAQSCGLFAPLPPLTQSRKPRDTEEGKAAGESYKAFKESLTRIYNAARGDIADEETERKSFFESGKTAVAFSRVMRQFDAEYGAIKLEENKLDYSDLEHLTLKLLSDKRALPEINSRFSCVFVDEYQDVNPVQEEIISRVGGENVFLVGDVKQAIYGFRGSRSLFFAEKYNSFEGGGGSALRLSNNFRSSDGVIDFVNDIFSRIMNVSSCGFNYSDGSKMVRGGGYPQGYGSAEIDVFGKDDVIKKEISVYSVKADETEAAHLREGLAVLEIVERELKSKHYDLKEGAMRDTQAGDICILTRKRRGAEVAGIVRALTDAGYSVAGAQEQNICERPEVKEMIDILSYLDNYEQDIPLVTALLSPVGGFTCNELSQIRITLKGEGRISFRECCDRYLERFQNETSKKLIRFYRRTDYLRTLAEVLSAAEIIDKVLEGTGLEAVYSAGGGEKLRNLRRLAAEGEGISVSAFLAKLKEGGFEISAPGASSTDSIKIMTMHASKGLEFPVVIVADICASFKGREYRELPFDETFGFAPKHHDTENMLYRSTLLRRLTLARAAAEELKNELNLFYVACTRAMCKLHVLASEIKPYNPLGAVDAKCYAELFDMEKFAREQEIFVTLPNKRAVIAPALGAPDEELKARIGAHFAREYAYADSVNLPVKSSASAILKRNMEEPVFRPHELFPGEGETGTERGTAYHAYLQFCDFSVKDKDGVQKQIEAMCESGKISAEQARLLNADELVEILSMPVFSEVQGALLYREQEFLCRMQASDILEVNVDDGVLVQGAIDLLAVRGEDAWVIDYKYSKKSDADLIETYAKQLRLYKTAVSLITNRPPQKIRTIIVNIYKRSQIVLNER